LIWPHEEQQEDMVMVHKLTYRYAFAAHDIKPQMTKRTVSYYF